MKSTVLINPQAKDSSDRLEDQDLHKMATGGAAVLIASVFGNGLNYAFGIFLARQLGLDEFGLYALGLTIFNTLSLLVLFGMDTGAMKFVSEQLERKDHARVTRTIGLIALITLGCGVIAALGLALLSNFLNSSVYKKPGLDAVLLFFSMAIPFSALSMVCFSALQAFQTVRYTILIKYLWEPTGKFLTAAVLLWWGLGLHGVIAAIVGVLIVSTISSLFALLRLARMRLSDLYSWDRSDIRSLLAFSLPLTVVAVFGVIAPRSDILILGYWVSPQEVGIYLAAFQTSAMLSLVLVAFEASLAPIMSRAWSQKDSTRLEHAYQTASRLTLSLTAPLCVVIMLFSEELMHLFGNEFVVGAKILVIFAAAQVFNSAAGYANVLLLMSGQTRLVMANTILLGLILIAMTALLIPRWGMIGAASGAAIGFVMMTVTRVVQVWKIHHVHPFTWGLTKPLLASVALACFLFAVKTHVQPVYYPMLVAVAALIYLGVFAFLGFNKEDKVAFKSVLKKVLPT